METVKGDADGGTLASAVIKTTEMETPVQVQVESGTKESNTALFWKGLREINPNNLENTETDCGDVVRLYAYIVGKKKEVAKGIVMALAGSKHVRKVIPKGWRAVKITSYTSNAATHECPIPTGWAGQVKQQSVKEATGRTIVWPDSLLHSILHI